MKKQTREAIFKSLLGGCKMVEYPGLGRVLSKPKESSESDEETTQNR
jgi:hypothetical protein